MAKKVNNISYKGINHSPSLVSDNDGHASECANLSPDFNDLKPMPMPMIGNDTYQVPPFHKLIFVHRGVGYENYISISDDHTHIMLQDVNSNILYYMYNSPDFPYWTNDSEILAVEAVGNTLVVSTKSGTEYIVYQPDVPMPDQDDGGSYKPIGQNPPMPVIEFGLRNGDNDAYTETQLDIRREDNEYIDIQEIDSKWWFGKTDEPLLQEYVKGLVAKLNNSVAEDSKFNQPFLVRYAYKTKTGDYIMQSPPVLMLPSTDKCPILCRVLPTYDNGYHIYALFAATKCARLQYKISARPNIDDWKDIISGVDVFVTAPISNYDIECSTDAETGTALYVISTRNLPFGTDMDFGKIYANGDIEEMYDYLPPSIPDTVFTEDPAIFYQIKSVDANTIDANVKNASLFHKVASLDIDRLYTNGAYKDLPIKNLSSITTLPTLEDEYNSHCAISTKLMQSYNSRLNMANISQKVFVGFSNAYQPQSDDRHYEGTVTYSTPSHQPITGTVDVKRVFFNIKKNGKSYTVSPNSSGDDPSERLDYTTFIYYPDADCYEMVVYCNINYGGIDHWRYYTIQMDRHEYLNGSYWYDGMRCLGEYIAYNYSIGETGSTTAPTVTDETDLWYNIPNRFMMSATGNPWYFPLQETFDIGLREIRALAINAEQMTAPQYGQNPIYVFSTDGIWTIGINKDGTHNGISYVSGDVISEMQGLGVYPTASAPQIVFFKTARGIMAVSDSTTKEIDKVMKGRVFNPRVKLLPSGSIIDGIPTSGINSYMLDLIFGVCDDLPYADFAAASSLLYDYRNNRLLLYNKDKDYLYVYDVAADFWSKMLPMVVDESDQSPAMQEFNTRGRSTSYTTFNGLAMAGSDAILTDEEGYLWYVGGQPDENDINATQFGLYVSRPMRFGSDNYKTLSRVVHDFQLGSSMEFAKMGLWGSRDGQNYYQITTLRGTSYKFFIIALYTRMLPSSRYAYTAFEWEPRMQDKIR